MQLDSVVLVNIVIATNEHLLAVFAVIATDGYGEVTCDEQTDKSPF